ncbi:MAG: hypothetical protein QXU82_02360 [Candidatus Aenigmatarchaeota archaeon]
MPFVPADWEWRYDWQEGIGKWVPPGWEYKPDYNTAFDFSDDDPSYIQDERNHHYNYKKCFADDNFSMQTEDSRTYEREEPLPRRSQHEENGNSPAHLSPAAYSSFVRIMNLLKSYKPVSGRMFMV